MDNKKIALILDTNCFKNTKEYDFKRGEMSVFAKSMKSKDNIDVYIPSIVLEELKKHIKDDLHQSREKLSKYYDSIVTDATETIAFEKNEKEIDNFLKENNIVSIDCVKFADMNEVFGWYFESNSLFRGNKKEFPDAVILSACKNYFKKLDYDDIYFITKDSALEKAISDYPKFMNFKSTNRAMTKLLGFTNEDYYIAETYIKEKRILESVDLISFGSADSGDEIEVSIENIDIKNIEIICSDEKECLISISYNAIINGDINILDPYESSYDRETGTYDFPIYKCTNSLELNNINVVVNLVKNNNKIDNYEIVRKCYVDLTNYLYKMDRFRDLD